MDSTDRPVDLPPTLGAEPDSLLGGSPAPEVRPLGDTPAPQLCLFNKVAFLLFVCVVVSFLTSGLPVLGLPILFFIAVAVVAMVATARDLSSNLGVRLVQIIGISGGILFMLFMGFMVAAWFFAFYGLGQHI